MRNIKKYKRKNSSIFLSVLIIVLLLIIFNITNSKQTRNKRADRPKCINDSEMFLEN